MGMNPRLLRPTASGRFGALRVGLVAYWPFEEDASSGDVTAVDWTGRGNDLTSNNTVPSVPGKVGLAREFVAANTEFLSRASNADMQFGDNPWSISFWVYPTETASRDALVVAKDGVTSPAVREFYTLIRSHTTNSTNGLQLVVWNDNSSQTAVNAPGRSMANYTNRWWHYAITQGDGAVLLYENGTQVASGARTAGNSFRTTAAEFRVANWGFGTANTLNGIMDEVAKWSRTLSAAEVATLYNNGNGIDLRR